MNSANSKKETKPLKDIIFQREKKEREIKKKKYM